MSFDLAEVPFSRQGSWLALSWLKPRSASAKTREGLYLRTVRHGVGRDTVFRFDVLEDGEAAPYEIHAAPEVLRLFTKAGGVVELCMPDAKTIRIRGRHVGLRATMQGAGGGDYLYPYDKEHWIFNFPGALMRFMIWVESGSFMADAPWNRQSPSDIVLEFSSSGPSGWFDCVLQEFRSTWTAGAPLPSFEDSAGNVREEFESFRLTIPSVPVRLKECADLAAYVNWSSIVNPEGLMTRPGMLMSKNWMTNVWSWDHCFNAIALSYGNPELAWDQFMLLFDHQDDAGAIPDYLNNVVPEWNFSKPPIHGWALLKMMKNGAVNSARMSEAYGPLARWTEWWFTSRDYDGDGMPQYDHGNDSGWDNSTVFSMLPPIESPDLASFLVLQMDALSLVAEKLGKRDEAADWKNRADAFFILLMKHSFRGGCLVPLQSGTHIEVKNRSLLPYMQILLGNRLPQDTIYGLVRSLREDGFITECGLATENPASPDYNPDGYWRGPTWAPSTLLIIDGLNAVGEKELARSLAERFVGLVRKGGFAENFDSLTGDGLRDRAYTWTSSVFLILAHEYLV